MTRRLEAIIELAHETEWIANPQVYALIFRLRICPDPELEESLLRKLIIVAGEQAFDVKPYLNPETKQLARQGHPGKASQERSGP